MTDKAPVTVEQGDVDAANAWYADHIGEGVAPGSLCVAFASARLQSTAALEEEIKRLREALDDLQQAEAEYRLMHDRHGDGSRAAGRAWDLMRRSGDKARTALEGRGS